MCTVFGQDGLAFSGVGVGAGIGFGQAVGGFPLARSELGQELGFLLFAAVIHDGQRADARVRRLRHRKRVTRSQAFGHQHGGVEIHAETAVFFGNSRSQQAEFAGFIHERRHKLGRLGGVYFVETRMNLGAQKIAARLGDHLLLFRKLLGNEYLRSVRFFDQKFAPLDGGRFFNNCHNFYSLGFLNNQVK